MRARVGDMTFIVRSAGERTASGAVALLRDLITIAGGDPAAQVTVIQERPFAAAVRRTFELGLAAGRPWVVAMDADVLLLESALDRLAGLCSQDEPDVFKIGPMVLCKFHGGLCYRGVHCYPHRLLDRALALPIDPNDLRPETAIAQAMAKDGLASFSPATVVGVHDFEQSFRHIYLKMRLRGRRELHDEQHAAADASLRRRLAEIESRAAATGDPDLTVAAWGLIDGHADAASGSDSAWYDWNASYPQLQSRLDSAGLSEKSPWTPSARGAAERAIAAHDFGSDLRTPGWVRQRHGFTGGREHVLGKLGIHASSTGGAAQSGPEAAA